MGDFEEKLNAILSSPDAMAQVMSIAQSLGLNNTDGDEAPCPQQDTPPPQSAPFPDPSLLTHLLPLLQNKGETDTDAHHQLLSALEPFLQKERREKLKKALRAARLLSAGKAFMNSMGDDHV